jgi:nucleotide-binding universal stress UspA family protein
VLAFVEDTPRGREVPSAAHELAVRVGGTLTVVAVAVIERERLHCCDLRSGTWNRMQRELAAEQLRLTQAQLALSPGVSFVLSEADSVEAALAREAAARACDVIVVPEQAQPLLRRRNTLAARLRRRAGCDVLTAREATAGEASDPLEPSAGR